MRSRRLDACVRPPRRAGRATARWAAVAVVVGCEGGGATRPPTGTVNQPPTASFVTDVSEGEAPLNVRFDGSGSSDPDGSVAAWAWEFGDGSDGSGRVVAHVYKEPGSYTPALTVTDQRGATDRRTRGAIVVHSPTGSGDAEIHGLVWHDANADGVRGEDEDRVPALVVFLDDDGDGVRDSTELAAVTDSAGEYRFQGLDGSRSYTVTQELTLGWTNTAPGRGAAYARLPAGARGPPPVLPIIGGQVAAPGEFPFQVALVATGTRSLFCAGVFIARNWILTAAHCVDDGVDPDSIEVLAGTHDLANGGEALRVAGIVVHPGFSADSSLVNDLALLELAGEYMYPRVELLTAARASLAEPGTVATVAGWGRTSNDGRLSSLLKKMQAVVISNDACRSQLGSHIRSTTLCAGMPGSADATCNGDSGGPLLVPFRSRWMQAGVVSFGARICFAPSAFARISALADFPVANVPPERSGAVLVDWARGNAARVDFGNFR